MLEKCEKEVICRQRFIALQLIQNSEELMLRADNTIFSGTDELEINERLLKYTKLLLGVDKPLIYVNPPFEKLRHKEPRQCFYNAWKMNDFAYLEGWVRHRNSNFEFVHAWNFSSEHGYVDFTLKNPQQYDYFGLQIDRSIIFSLGLKFGGMSTPVLPFMERLISE
jgi:hypothetical protein